MTMLQEAIQGVVAICLIAAYVALALSGKGTDHLDLGIVGVMGSYFGGKVAQAAITATKDVTSAGTPRPGRATDPPPGPVTATPPT